MRKGLSIIVGIAILLFAYSASAGVETNGLVSWWKLDETSGISPADSHGTNHGNLYGQGTEGLWTTDTAGSASSGALYFAGDGDYINCWSNDSLNVTTAITIEVWVKFDELGVTEVPISRGAYDYVIQKYSNKSLYFYVDGASTYRKFSEIEDCDWHHIAYVYDGSAQSLKGYLDGDEMSVTASNGTIPSSVSLAGTWQIGRRDTMDYYKGIIDDVRIYNRPLTGDEIKGNYDAIPEPSTLLLLGAGLFGLLSLRRLRK